MPTPRKARIHVPEAQLRLIGLISATWAQFEHAIERLIWRAADLNGDTGAAITTHMSLKARLDAACAVIELHFPKSVPAKRLAALKTKINRTVADKRNKAIHNRIIGSMGDISLRADTTARGALRPKVTQLKDADFQEAADEINAALVEARDIMSALYPLLEARKESRRPS